MGGPWKQAGQVEALGHLGEPAPRPLLPRSCSAGKMAEAQVIQEICPKPQRRVTSCVLSPGISGAAGTL